MNLGLDISKVIKWFLMSVMIVIFTGCDDNDTVTASTTPPVVNTAPVADAGTPQSVETGTTTTLDGSASSDADSDPLTYSWSFTSVPAGSALITLTNPTVVSPTFTSDVDGDYVIQLIVNDGTENSTPASVTVTASTTPPVNTAPVADAGTPQSVETGTTTTLDGSGSSDADSDPLTYSWSFTSVPTGSALTTLTNPTAVDPTFTSDVDGDYVVQLIVNDGTENSTPASVTVTASTTNTAPVVDTPIADQNSSHGDLIDMNISGNFSDTDGDTLTYSAAGLPAGLSLDPDSGIISGTISESGSPYSVTITADDGNGGTVDNSFIWLVGTVTVYEDAEDGLTDGWIIYDDNNASVDTNITNVDDVNKSSKVIELSGEGLQDGYQLGDFSGGADDWNNNQEGIIRWSVKYNNNFRFFVIVTTSDGLRYLTYATDLAESFTKPFVIMDISSEAIADTWQDFTKDLAADLARVENNSSVILETVHGIQIRGNMRVDDIELHLY